MFVHLDGDCWFAQLLPRQGGSFLAAVHQLMAENKYPMQPCYIWADDGVFIYFTSQDTQASRSLDIRIECEMEPVLQHA